MTKHITITVEGRPNSGKTTTALRIKKALEKFGAEVEFNDLIPNTVVPSYDKKKTRKVLAGKRFIVNVKQIARTEV